MLKQIFALTLLILFARENALAQSCGCPPGYVPGIGGNHCSQTLTATPNIQTGVEPIIQGDYDWRSHLTFGNYTVETDGNTNTPFTAQFRNYPVLDSTNATLAGTPFALTVPWITYLRANQIKALGDEESGLWYSKTFCLNVPQDEHESFFVGGDNVWRLKIDGQTFAQCTSNRCFDTGLFLGKTMPAGRHFVELKYRNFDYFGGVWFAAFANSNAEVQTLPPPSAGVQPPASLTERFSTGSLRSAPGQPAQNWDYSSVTGDVCPAGYSYDGCDTRQCVLINTAPCFPSIDVTPTSACGDPVEIAYNFRNEHPVSTVWKLYKLTGSGGSRIQPALATAQRNFAPNAGGTFSIYTLFSSPQLTTLLGNDLISKFELEVTTTDLMTLQSSTVPGKKFVVNMLKTQIHIINNPDHPDSNPISPTQLGPFSVYKDSPIVFEVKRSSGTGVAANAWEWTMPRGSPSTFDNVNPTHPTTWTLLESGEIPITAISRYPNGCVSKATTALVITTKDAPFVPTAFTPNNDGKNDLFRPSPLGNFDWIDFSVYNRWGERVHFENSGGQPKGWDGRYQGRGGSGASGQPQDTNVFVVMGHWRRRGDINGKVNFYKGTVVLIR